MESTEPIVPTRPPELAAPPPPSPPRLSTPSSPPSNVVRKPAPADARVYFLGLQNGARVGTQVTVRFGVFNMGVAPAGIDRPNTGHHHILIDTPLPPLDEPIPNDFNHLHFGAGQTEAVITLPPGKHTLQLLLGDDTHMPHNPPVKSDRIEITVTP